MHIGRLTAAGFSFCCLAKFFSFDDHVWEVAQINELVDRQPLQSVTDHHFDQIAAGDCVSVMRGPIRIEKPIDGMKLSTDDAEKKRRPMRRADVDDAAFG